MDDFNGIASKCEIPPSLAKLIDILHLNIDEVSYKIEVGSLRYLMVEANAKKSLELIELNPEHFKTKGIKYTTILKDGRLIIVNT